jgi:hypothetical protein
MILHNGKIIKVSHYNQYDRRYDYVEPYYYCGLAPYNSLDSDPVWDITRIEENLDGTTTEQTATNVSWDNRYSEIYV